MSNVAASVPTFRPNATKFTPAPARMPAAPAAKRGDEIDFTPIAASAREVKFHANQAIYFEGDDAEHCFKVISGTVRLCKITDDGRRQIAAFVGTGGFFGWTGATVHKYAAEAVTGVVLAKYPCARVDAAVATNPQFGRRLLGLITTQLHAAQEHLLLLGRKTAGERLATFLLDLICRRHGEAAQKGRLVLPMSRTDIADYLGLTVETVSSTLSSLRSQHVIAVPTPEIIDVRNAAALRDYAMMA